MTDKIKILILACLVLIGGRCVKAQTPLEGSARDEALLRILAPYSGWNTVELNGSVKIPNLPMGIKPSLKIFMKNGESVMMSARAPFMGEVARVEISADSIMVANKMKRNYCKTSLKTLLKGFRASVSDLQSLLLGRIALLGEGELSVANSSQVSILQAADGSLMVVPDNSIQPQGAEYGFLAGEAGKLQVLLISIQGQAFPVSIIYDYLLSGGHSLSFDNPNGKLTDISMEFGKPQWGVSPLSPFKPDKNYTRLGMQQFINSF